MGRMLNVKEVSELLGVGNTKAYEYIRIMNEELKSKGFLTVRGKVPAAYLNNRFFGATKGEEIPNNTIVV